MLGPFLRPTRWLVFIVSHTRDEELRASEGMKFSVDIMGASD